MKKYKLAIVGATGLVGRTALKILEEKNIQNLEYTLFSSKKSAGTELKFMNTRYLVHELKDFSFESQQKTVETQESFSEILSKLKDRLPKK